jgi:hypothetical protein
MLTTIASGAMLKKTAKMMSHAGTDSAPVLFQQDGT